MLSNIILDIKWNRLGIARQFPVEFCDAESTMQGLKEGQESIPCVPDTDWRRN